MGRWGGWTHRGSPSSICGTFLLFVRLGTGGRVCEPCTLRGEFNPRRKQSSYRLANSLTPVCPCFQSLCSPVSG